MKGFTNKIAYVNRVSIWYFCIYLKLSIEQNQIEVVIIALWYIGILVPVTYAFIISNKKYTGSNLKTTELLDCALIG